MIKNIGLKYLLKKTIKNNLNVSLIFPNIGLKYYITKNCLDDNIIPIIINYNGTVQYVNMPINISYN